MHNGGVAPEASIAIVRTDFLDSHIQDGVSWIFERAKELGLPAVVNISAGDHGGPHDGSDALDQRIDAESGPGRIVVAAAGNEGADNVHTSVCLAAGDQADLGFRVAGAQNGIGLSLWYDGDAELEFSVSTPGGSSTAFHAETAADPGTAYRLASCGEVTILVADRDPENRIVDPGLVRGSRCGSRTSAGSRSRNPFVSPAPLGEAGSA